MPPGEADDPPADLCRSGVYFQLPLKAAHQPEPFA
jgi:hypothetical protein